jgi:Tfp pilus assembly protein PilO
MIKASTKRALSLLVSMALIIASLAIYAFYVRPAYDDVTTLRGTMKAKQDLFLEKQVAVDKVKALILQYKGAGSLQDAISLSLPQTEEVSSVFNQLQAIASSNGMAVEVFNVQPLPIRAADAGSGKNTKGSLIRPLGTLRLSLRLTGTYPAFKDFVRGLETNIRAMDVVSMKVEQASAKGGESFAYTLVADAYYQVP